MPRSTDTNDIESFAMRAFIDTMDWKINEERQFYYTGHEKVQKVSKAGNPYTQYFIYLLKVIDGKVGGEETLAVFASLAQAIKGMQQFQSLTVKKTMDENMRESWEFTPGTDFLAPKDRPELPEYGEFKSKAPQAPEVNLDDIPF